ncbi:acetylpolyamine aminohydrolase [Paraphysoderma sedebokerense]|nr:acetylpolyamine aminohydrolase [Paraphysoderma sedebokerense]
MKTVYSEKSLLHITSEILFGKVIESAYECPQRIINIVDAIKSRNLGPILSPSDFGLDPILAVHTKDYVVYLKTIYNQWVESGGNPEAVIPETFPHAKMALYSIKGSKKGTKNEVDETACHSLDEKPVDIFGLPGYYAYDLSASISKDSWEAIYWSAQVAVTGAKLLLEENEQSVFALCRPPGHHCYPDLAGGYCYLNNAAIATKYLLNKLQSSSVNESLSRIAIIDVDFHHGNGTQQIFYDSSSVFYVSLHGENQYPYYSGRSTEIGEAAGKDHNLNIPLPLGTNDAEYLEALGVAIEAVKRFDPNVVVVSLGVDTFNGDVLGGFFLTSDCYTKIGRLTATLNKKTLFVLEGGYVIEKIGLNVTNVLFGFEGKII